MSTILSCDWGTTIFRIRLIDISSHTILNEISSHEGIASTYHSWKTRTSPQDRFSFFLNVIGQKIKEMEQDLSLSFVNIPILLSGMASSSLGLLELPYKSMPFKADGSNLLTHTIEPTNSFPHEIFFISGVNTSNDVMRGEETKLVGSYENEDGIFIFPGTHSKHIHVQNGIVTNFATYMTGEIFDAISKGTILSNSIKSDNYLSNPKYQRSFRIGVRTGYNSNILHSCFSARTNTLFNKFSKEENYFYLSGLLIGNELSDLKVMHDQKITLSGSEILVNLYRDAFKILGLVDSAALQIRDGADTLIKGQLSLYKMFSKQLA